MQFVLSKDNFFSSANEIKRFLHLIFERKVKGILKARSDVQ